MCDWLPALYNCLALLGGVVLTNSLFLYSQFYSESKGYIWRAAQRIRFYLRRFSAAEWIVGLLIFLALRGLQRPAPALAFVTGVGVAAVLLVVESILLPRAATARALRRPLTRRLLRLNATPRYNYARAIESCRQQDVFDCQKNNSWGLNIRPQTTGRRLRIVYEHEKVRIAARRRDSSFLHFDQGYTPWIKFYVLVKHLGRRRLRELIGRPVDPPGVGWDGSERRRREEGSRADRLDPGGAADAHSRVYDDPDFVRRVERGEVPPRER